MAEEGGGRRRRKNERHRTKKKEKRRECSCLLNVGAASRADAEASSLSKPEPLSYTLYSNLLSPLLLLLLPSLPLSLLGLFTKTVPCCAQTTHRQNLPDDQQPVLPACLCSISKHTAQILYTIILRLNTHSLFPHTHTHARTHARTHTHTHTQALSLSTATRTHYRMLYLCATNDVMFLS